MRTQIIRMKPYIKPFEKILAVDELAAICGIEAILAHENDEHEYSIPEDCVDAASTKLAYWEVIGRTQITAQVRRELTLNIARKTTKLSDLDKSNIEKFESRLPQSRCLRYGPHGIHEYRGKFFPQLVRALINKSGIEQNSLVLDPMCGSGTTLVEAATRGMKTVGMDVNPLSVLMSSVKLASLKFDPDELLNSYFAVCTEIEKGCVGSNEKLRDDRDEDYLHKWFQPHVVRELDLISSAIRGTSNTSVSQLLIISLSNILRSVSMQRVVDLRVRREEKDIPIGETMKLFRTESERSIKAIAAFLKFGELGNVGAAAVFEQDARTFLSNSKVADCSVDLVVTSPPYATALPYLDTDRLSLSYLGLLPRSDHRSRDTLMIGNREISEKTRVQQWLSYEQNRYSLPLEVRELIEKIEFENKAGRVGFRRKNLGALLAKYFFDMNEVLKQIHKSLKLGGMAFLVVGNNRTTTPQGEVEIETAKFLLSMAEKIGFADCEISGMDMLVSRDIFRTNQTPSEHVISLRRQK